jgi:hypothetical protein
MEVNNLLHPPATVVRWKEIPVPMKKIIGSQSPFKRGGELKISVPSGNEKTVFHLTANSLTSSLPSYINNLHNTFDRLRDLFTFNAGYNTCQRLWFLSTVRSIRRGFYIIRGIVHAIYTPLVISLIATLWTPLHYITCDLETCNMLHTRRYGS